MTKQWQLTTPRKGCEEHEYFMNAHGSVFKVITGWNRGTFYTECDTKPEFEPTEQFIELMDCGDWELVEASDSFYGGLEFSPETTDEQREHIEQLWDAGSYEALERAGYRSVDTEWWVANPLVVEES